LVKRSRQLDVELKLSLDYEQVENYIQDEWFRREVWAMHTFDKAINSVLLTFDLLHRVESPRTVWEKFWTRDVLPKRIPKLDTMLILLQLKGTYRN